MGVYVRIRSDASGNLWAGSTLNISHGATGNATWSYSTQFPYAKDASGYDAIEDIITWANAGARPWTGVVTFTSDHQELSSGMVWNMHATASVTWTPGGNFRAMTGAPAAVLDTDYEITAGVAPGSFAPSSLAFRNHIRAGSSGGASGDGAWLEQYHATAPYRGEIEMVTTELQELRLTNARAIAGSPRRGWVYDEVADTWRLLSLGAMREPDRQTQLYKRTFAAEAEG